MSTAHTPSTPTPPHAPVIARPRLDEDGAAALAELRTKFGGVSTNDLMRNLADASDLLLLLQAKFAGLDNKAFREIISDFLPDNNDDLESITEAAQDAGVPRAALILDATKKYLNHLESQSGRTTAVFDKIEKGVREYAAAGRPISQGRIAMDFAGGNKRAVKRLFEKKPEWISEMQKLSDSNRPAQVAQGAPSPAVSSNAPAIAKETPVSPVPPVAQPVKPAAKPVAAPAIAAPATPIIPVVPEHDGGWDDKNAPESTIVRVKKGGVKP